jgi:hypothetical protein
VVVITAVGSSEDCCQCRWRLLRSAVAVVYEVHEHDVCCLSADVLVVLPVASCQATGDCQ